MRPRPITAPMLAEDPEEMRRIGEAMLPFLRDLGEEAKQYQVRYNKRRLIQLLGALKGGYFMRAVENDPQIPYDIKMTAANATTSMAKFSSFVFAGVDSPAFDDVVKLLYFARTRLDRILGYLEVESRKISQIEREQR